MTLYFFVLRSSATATAIFLNLTDYGRRIIILDATKYYDEEGDDYWIDLLKLQKQVDFMEKNMSYSLCGTKTQRFNESGVKGKIRVNYMER